MKSTIVPRFDYRTHRNTTPVVTGTKRQPDLFSDIHGSDLFSDVKLAASKDPMQRIPQARDYSPKHEVSNRNEEFCAVALIAKLTDSVADKEIRIKRLMMVGDSVILHLLGLLNQSEDARNMQAEAFTDCLNFKNQRICELETAVRNGDKKVQWLERVRNVANRMLNHDVEFVAEQQEAQRLALIDKDSKIFALNDQVGHQKDSLKNLNAEYRAAMEELTATQEENQAMKRSIRTLKSWTSKYRDIITDEKAVSYDLFLQMQEVIRNNQTTMGALETAASKSKDADFDKLMASSEKFQ